MSRKLFSKFKLSFLLLLLSISTYACNSTTDGTIYELAPSSPTGFTATADNNSVFLSWNLVDKAMVYTVYMSDNITGTYKAVATTNAISTEVSSLTNGTKYYFKIAARNLSGRSSYSETIDCIPVPPVTVPASPNIQITSIVDRNLFLGWNSVATAKSYEVHSSADNITWTLIAQTVDTFYDVKELNYNSTHFYYVVAKNNIGPSEPSAVLDVTITSATELNVAPTNFYALPSDTTATLFWSKVDNATSYAVYILNDSNVFEPLGNTSNTYFTAKNLVNNKNYQFKVVPLNSLGASKIGAIASTTPQPFAFFIDRVKSIVATSLSNSILLEWKEVPSALAYNVYISENEDFSNFKLLKTVDNVSTLVTGLENNKEYYFAVSAVNGRLEGLQSVMVTAIPRDIVITLDKPYAVNILSGDTLLLVSWSPVRYADKYVIYRSLDGNNFNILATVNTTYFVDRSLANGTDYYYKILPKNDVIEGTFSDVAVGRPLAPLDRPNSPTGLQIENIDDYLYLDWDSVLNARYYNIYRSIGSSTEFIKVRSSVGSSEHFYDLDDGVQYNFYITAVNERGESGRSLIVSSTYHQNVHKPNKILGVTANAITGGIYVSWIRADYASYYTIYVAQDGGEFLPVITTNSSRATINFLGSLGKYNIRVTGSNYLGEGVASDVATVDITEPLSKPQRVTGLVASGYKKGILLSWQPAYSATEYKVYMYDTATSSYIYYDNHTTTSVTIDTLKDANATPLSNDTEYSFYVTAVNNIGESDKSDNVTAKTDFAPTPKDVVGLTALGLDTQVNLRWLDSDYADYYEIWRGPNDSSPLVHVANAVVAGYNDFGLTNGTTYRYKIIAKNNVNESQPAYITATPKAPDFRPVAPTISNAITGKTSILVVLQAVPTATSYKVYYKKNTDSSYTLGAEGINLSYILDNLVTGSAYDIIATAVNSYGESTNSLVTRIATTNSASVPSKPTELEFSTSSSIPILKWKAGGASDQYYIYYSANNRDYILFDITYSNAYAFNFSTPSNGGTKYYFKVRRVSNNMVSDFSDYYRMP